MPTKLSAALSREMPFSAATAATAAALSLIIRAISPLAYLYLEVMPLVMMGTKTVTIPAPRVQASLATVSMLPLTTVSFVMQVDRPQ